MSSRSFILARLGNVLGSGREGAHAAPSDEELVWTVPGNVPEQAEGLSTLG